MGVKEAGALWRDGRGGTRGDICCACKRERVGEGLTLKRRLKRCEVRDSEHVSERGWWTGGTSLMRQMEQGPGRGAPVAVRTAPGSGHPPVATPPWAPRRPPPGHPPLVTPPPWSPPCGHPPGSGLDSANFVNIECVPTSCPVPPHLLACLPPGDGRPREGVGAAAGDGPGAAEGPHRVSARGVFLRAGGAAQ